MIITSEPFHFRFDESAAFQEQMHVHGTIESAGHSRDDSISQIHPLFLTFSPLRATRAHHRFRRALSPFPEDNPFRLFLPRVQFRSLKNSR